MKKLFALALFTLVAALGADLTGTWKGKATVKTDEGDTRDIPVTLVLKSVGEDKLEGTTQAEGDENALPIRSGKVDGNKVYFELKAESDNGTILFQITMEQTGDNLAGTFTRDQGGNKQTGKVTFTKTT